MASINYAAREISVKVVFYGPGLSGKTTNLQVIHRKIPAENRSDMVSLATETDRTLFFDFLPIDLGKIKGFSTKFQLYTVPGQVYYNATRKLVLRGVDGVVFVADSAPDKMDENLESFQNLEENLAEYGYQRESIPIIIQYNKRDLPNALSIPELQAAFNKYNLPFAEAVAARGIGVFESLKLIGKIVLDHLNKKYDRQPSSAARPQAAPIHPLPQQPQTPPPPAMQSAPPVMPPAQPYAPSRQQPFAQPPVAPAGDSYMNYGTISLESMNTPAGVHVPQQAAAMAQPKVEFDNEIEQYQNHFAAQPASDDEHEIFEVNTSAALPTAPLAQQTQQFSQQPHAYGQQQPTYQQPQPFAPPQQVPQFGTQTQQFQHYQQTQQFQQQQFQQPQFQQQMPQQQAQFQQQQFQQPQFQQQQQMAPQQQYQQFQQPAQFQQQQNYQQTAQFQTFQQPPQQQNSADANDYNVYNAQQAAPFQPPIQRPQQPPQNNFDDTMYFTSVDTEKRHKTRKPINPKNQKKGLFSRMFNRNDPL